MTSNVARHAAVGGGPTLIDGLASGIVAQLREEFAAPVPPRRLIIQGGRASFVTSVSKHISRQNRPPLPLGRMVKGSYGFPGRRGGALGRATVQFAFRGRLLLVLFSI